MFKCIDFQIILIFGSGFIQIGQVVEFDYFGIQVFKVLKNEGYCVILVNFNLVIIMIDLELVDVMYLELLMFEFVEKIIEKEKLDVILFMLGGQMVLNLVMELYECGSFEKYGVEFIGVGVEVIKKGEDCELFQVVMKKIGVEIVCGKMVYFMEEVVEYQKEIGLFIVIWFSFIFGGMGGGIVYIYEEFLVIMEGGLCDSFVIFVLLEESILGWKEYELEVMCDMVDMVIIIISIENFDLMGVYMGDFIIVVFVQMFSDVEYQWLCDQFFVIICEIGVVMGGSNIQFVVNFDNGCVIVIEMNLCVSCFLVLVSKVIGFLIVKIVVLLVVGYYFDELFNDIICVILVSFELSIDYVVIKILCFVFEKFFGMFDGLGMQMCSVGEVMVIGCIFKELL